MRSDLVPINEWQIGSALNRAIRTDQRGDFGWLLSSLVQDVRYQGQFDYGHEYKDETGPLRQKLGVAPATAYTEAYSEPERGIRNAEAFRNGGLVASRLQHCIAPEPLTYQGQFPHGLAVAIANAGPHVEQSHQTEAKVQLRKQQGWSGLIAQQRAQSRWLAAA